jgi:hypothetical protein
MLYAGSILNEEFVKGPLVHYLYLVTGHLYFTEDI